MTYESLARDAVAELPKCEGCDKRWPILDCSTHYRPVIWTTWHGECRGFVSTLKVCERIKARRSAP